MAVTALGDTFVMTAAADSLNQATVGHIHMTSPYVARVRAIVCAAGATGGATVVNRNGLAAAGGKMLVSFPGTASTAGRHEFGTPVDVENLTVETIGTNVNVIVELA